MDSALGLLETRGLLASVVGADAALKAAVVTLKGLEKVGGGLTTVVLTGEVAAMAAALSAAEAAALPLTGYCRAHLIPRLDVQVRPILNLDGGPAAPPATLPPTGDGRPEDPVYWETPPAVAPGEVVELSGPGDVLALGETPEEARELLPAVPVSGYSPGAYPEDPENPETEAPGAEAPGAEDREPAAAREVEEAGKLETKMPEVRKADERKPTETKAAKSAAKKSRKR